MSPDPDESTALRVRLNMMLYCERFVVWTLETAKQPFYDEICWAG